MYWKKLGLCKAKDSYCLEGSKKTRMITWYVFASVTVVECAMEYNSFKNSRASMMVIIDLDHLIGLVLLVRKVIEPKTRCVDVFQVGLFSTGVKLRLDERICRT